MNTFADRMQDLINVPGVTPLAFLFAFLAGAWHAVMPGHGKTLAAAYLAGTRGRIRDAAWLGGSVAVMHTLSVLVIGLAWTFLSLSDVIRLEALTTWLQIAAGILIVATGGWMLRRHLHSHHHHHHHHGESRHGKRPGLILLGISGGLTPSPAAFLVLVTGLFLGRSVLALLMVITFGIGMSVVLFAVGVLAVWGSSLVTSSSRTYAMLRSATRVTPLFAAGGVTLFGAGLITVSAVHLAGLA
ncbi:cobalt transporter [Actinoplanes sp. G11-F43]|uniref:HoxN/HupN/NixA family nickel/cobalt transporter n=1 Tax=Actinoplanes sp. G11-F43 TaxID=3424130 RepID=UPI003D32BCF5